MSKTLSEWGMRDGDNTIVGIDKLKQVLDDFRLGNQDSKKFDTFVTALRGEAQNIIRTQLKKSKDIKALDTYNRMTEGWQNSTRLIKEIERGLSLGNRAQTDTAFRKLTTVLKTNNEFRKQLIDELDSISGETLLPKIAGQQLSELTPRGLMRPLTALGGGGLAVTGAVGIIPLLQAALFTSPRLVGEILRVLGYSSGKIQKILEAIMPQGVKIQGIEEAMGKPPKKPAKLG
jgi:hypothetical protein